MAERLCLIVDDEPAIRAYVRVVLRQRGIRSLEAQNALDALRIVQSLGGQIDVLITDVDMPGGMNGIDLAHAVKDQFRPVRVIMISGRTDDAPIDFQVIQKPFTADAIVNALDR